MAVPLSGPDESAGQELVRGVRLAAGDAFAVLVDDDTQPGCADSLARIPEVMGVVAHVGAPAAAKQGPDWKRVHLPTVIGAPGGLPSLPSVLPPPDQLAGCTARLIGQVPYVVRTDGTPDALATAGVLKAALPTYFKGEATVTPTDVATEAAKLQGRREQVVYVGDPKLGGDLLRAMRAFSEAPFFGVSARDPAFVAAAGSAAENARVSGQSRPARDPTFLAAYRERYGEVPEGSAVDGYDAARLLIAAWQVAHGRNPAVTRSAVAEALPGVAATGSGGAMHLDPSLVLQPVGCQAYLVQGGQFVAETAASMTDPPQQPEAATRSGGRRKRAEGEWLGLPPPGHEGDPAPAAPGEPVHTPSVRRP